MANNGNQIRKIARERSAENGEDYIFVVEDKQMGMFFQFHEETYNGACEISSAWKKGKRCATPAFAKKLRAQHLEA